MMLGEGLKVDDFSIDPNVRIDIEYIRRQLEPWIKDMIIDMMLLGGVDESKSGK